MSVIRRKDWTGLKVGLLYIVDFSHNEIKERKDRCPMNQPVWNCRCECGATLKVIAKLLSTNEKRHCGSLECKRVNRTRMIREKYERSVMIVKAMGLSNES